MIVIIMIKAVMIIFIMIIKTITIKIMRNSMMIKFSLSSTRPTGLLRSPSPERCGCGSFSRTLSFVS